jgi:hypothetical protein
VIVGGRRVHRIYDAKFWEGYRNVPAWEFMRFLALAEKGSAPAAAPGAPGGMSAEQRGQAQREDLEASFRACREMLPEA